MGQFRYVFGPVPSRRLGRSLGVSPIPEKTCNYSCIYCQLGRTDRMTNQRAMFFPVEEILAELHQVLADQVPFDVVTVVGEGEPTLYAGLGELLDGIHGMTEKAAAVITNGALLSDPQVRHELMKADIVLPSLDAPDAETFHTIDRPYGRLEYDEVCHGLELFCKEFPGQIWLEIMLVQGRNDDDASLERFAQRLSRLRYDRLYINTPVRPPAEPGVFPSEPRQIQRAVEKLGGISIDMLSSGSFFSDVPDDYEAILSIIRRHPMNHFEILGFLESRKAPDKEKVFQRLAADPQVQAVQYKGYTTYRFQQGALQ